MTQRNRVVRLRSIVAASIAMSLALAGCSSNSDTDNRDPGSLEGVEINVAGANTPWWTAITQHVAEFEEETGIKVTVSDFGEDQLADQNQVKLNAKSTDLDVIAIRPIQELRLYVDNGWLADLSEFTETSTELDWEDFQPATREAMTLEDSVWSIPVMTERTIVYYNTDLLEQAGADVPETLEELEDAVASINALSDDVYGIAMRGAANPAITAFAGFLYSFGGEWQNEDGTSAISSPEAIEAYDYYGRLLREYGPPGVTTMGWTEASAIFAQGKAGFYIDFDSQAHVFQNGDNSRVVDSFGYAPFPAGPAGAHAPNTTPWSVAVSAFSEEKEASYKFIEWATSAEMMERALSEKQNPSPRTSTWASETATEGFPQELVDIIALYTEIGVPYDRPRNIQVAQARDIIGKPITASIEGRDVAEAAKAASDEYDSFLLTDN